MECISKGKSTKRNDKEYKDLIVRLKKIEGQVRGIMKMVEDERYCIDIMNQVSAASSALNSFNRVLLNSHMRHCVVNDIKKGNDETLDELEFIFKKLIK